MKRIVSVMAAAFMLLVLALPASAQESARISLINGIPDTPLDFEIEGTGVFTDVAFGATQDISSLAGATLVALKVKLAGTSTVAVDAGNLALPASGSHSIILHLDAAGEPRLSVFVNDTSFITAGQGRLVFRHAAAAPAAGLQIAVASVLGNVSNSEEVSADLAAGSISVEVVAADADPVLLGPAELNVADGQGLIVYLVGSEEDGTLELLTEVIGDLGTAPTGVETGNSPVGIPGAVWAAATVAVIIGMLGVRRTRARNRA